MGWLGCQPRFLRRYISLYESLGLDVLPIIPSPSTVVDATFTTSPKRVEWPATASTCNIRTHIPPPSADPSSSSMEQLAHHVINEIQNKQARGVLFHVFSNGGCFLWEQVRRLTDFAENPDDPSSKAPNATNPDIKGVVFDSCPAWFGDENSVLSAALNHCSAEEKKRIVDQFGSGVFYGEEQEQREQRKQRNQEFFKFLKEDQFDIPQLYVYCKNDPLSDHERIRDLVRFRTNHSRGPVIQKRWSDSVHCAHLQRHPTEYAELVGSFIAVVFRQARL